MRQAVGSVHILQASDSTLAAAGGLNTLARAASSLATNIGASTVPLFDLAQGYIGFAGAFWALYLPNFPIDPAIASRAREAALDRKKNRLVGASAIQSRETEEPGGLGVLELNLLAKQLAQVESALGELEDPH